MSTIKNALNSPAAVAYYRAAAELHDGLAKSTDDIRRYLPGWRASESLKAAAVAAHAQVKEAYYATLESLGGFADQVESDAELDARVVRELINGGQSTGTRDDLEFKQFMLALKETRDCDYG